MERISSKLPFSFINFFRLTPRASSLPIVKSNSLSGLEHSLGTTTRKAESKTSNSPTRIENEGTFVTGRGGDFTLDGQKLQLVDLVTSAKDATGSDEDQVNDSN